ncbi:MAG TPA: hypothetical protein VGL89_19860 [Candidatus Koribacter sp.]|jgi:hypothetical protein
MEQGIKTMQEKTVFLELAEEHQEAIAEKEDKKRGWIRFKQDQHFGPVIGGDFRVWGED